MQARTIVALIAAQAALLAATLPARADFKLSINGSLSHITYSEFYDLSVVALPGQFTIPQYPDPDGAGYLTGSDTARVFGMMYAKTTPGFFELLPGELVGSNQTPGQNGVPGAFSPFDPVYQDPSGVPGGATPNANFGVMTGGVAPLYRTMHGLYGDWFTTSPGPRPMLPDGSFSYIAGQDFLLAQGGRTAFTSSGLGSDTQSMVGVPLAALGTGGLANPSMDFLDLTGGVLGTLRLPIESFYTDEIDLSHIVPGLVMTRTVMVDGLIVATPILPEPSSMALLGLGVVGLLVCCWRRRARKP